MGAPHCSLLLGISSSLFLIFFFQILLIPNMFAACIPTFCLFQQYHDRWRLMLPLLFLIYSCYYLLFIFFYRYESTPNNPRTKLPVPCLGKGGLCDSFRRFRLIVQRSQVGCRLYQRTSRFDGSHEAAGNGRTIFGREKKSAPSGSPISRFSISISPVFWRFGESPQ